MVDEPGTAGFVFLGAVFNRHIEFPDRLLVSEGASIFRQIDPETLFARDEGWEGWCLDHLERWKGLYLSAAENNEEILVGVA